MKYLNRWSWCLGLAVALTAIPACSPKPATPTKAEHEHPSKGPHGGPVAGFDKGTEEVGHAEITLSEDGKQVIVYFLDEKAEKPMSAPADKITDVKVTLKKPAAAGPVDLKHSKELSGDKGHAFVGDLEKALEKKDLEGSIKVTIDGTTFDEEFPEKPH